MSRFQKDRGRPDGLQAHCRECRAGIARRWLDRHRDVRRRYQKAVRRRNLLRIMEYLRRHPCVDCGERDPVVLEFDHCGPKRAAVAEMIRSYFSWKAIENEITRCEVRCANCHRRKTAREQGWIRRTRNPECKARNDAQVFSIA